MAAPVALLIAHDMMKSIKSLHIFEAPVFLAPGVADTVLTDVLRKQQLLEFVVAS